MEGLRALANELARSLGARTGLVLELRPGEPRRLRVRAACSRGEERAELVGLELEVVGSPCERVFGPGWSFHARGLLRLFPAFALALEPDGAEAFLGLVFADARGRTLGQVAVLHDRALRPTRAARQAMRACAARAGNTCSWSTTR